MAAAHTEGDGYCEGTVLQQLYRLFIARCIHSYWALQLRRPLDRPASPQYDANPSLVTREDDPGLFPMITALILRHYH